MEKELTDYSTDVIKLQSKVQHDLLHFLQKLTDKIVVQNDIRKSVEGVIQQRLASKDDELSDLNLIRLYEISCKAEDNLISNVFSLLRETQKTPVASNNPNRDSGGNSDLTKEDVQNVKEIISIFDEIKRLEKSEASEEELGLKK